MRTEQVFVVSWLGTMMILPPGEGAGSKPVFLVSLSPGHFLSAMKHAGTLCAMLSAAGPGLSGPGPVLMDLLQPPAPVYTALIQAVPNLLAPWSIIHLVSEPFLPWPR